MTFKKLIPEIYTNQLQETLEFYTKILKFHCITENSDFWVILKKDNIEIMLSRPNAHFPFFNSQFTGTLLIEVDNAYSYWEEIHPYCEIIYPIQDFDYGLREFAFYDNNKFIIRIVQSI